MIGLQFGPTKGDGKWAKLGWIGLGLKEIGLGSAMGRMGSDCLQLRFRTPFDVLAFIFSTNIGSMQSQFLQKIDLNTFPSIYGTFSRSKPKNMVNFSISVFCSVLAARPPCSKLDAAPSRKMIKMRGQIFWKLDSYIFPTPLTSYFYHF